MTPRQRARVNAARLFATSIVDLVARLDGEHADRMRYAAEEVCFADLQAEQYSDARALLRDARKLDPRSEALDGGSTNPHAARAAAAGYLVAVCEDDHPPATAARLRAVCKALEILWPHASTAARVALRVAAGDGATP